MQALNVFLYEFGSASSCIECTRMLAQPPSRRHTLQENCACRVARPVVGSPSTTKGRPWARSVFLMRHNLRGVSTAVQGRDNQVAAVRIAVRKAAS